MPQTNQELIQLLKDDGVLKSPSIEAALCACPREFFAPEEYKSEAYGNYPLPIGESQTISQPLTVVLMLELLDVTAGQKVLEIGYGSGWQTALLSHLVGRGGQVLAFEINSKVAAFGKENLERFGTVNRFTVPNWQHTVSEFSKKHAQSLQPGELLTPASPAGRSEVNNNLTLFSEGFGPRFKEFAPYDRIISGAAFDRVPQDLKEALKDGGRMVVPTQENDLRVIVRDGDSFKEDIIPGFVFVPIR